MRDRGEFTRPNGAYLTQATLLPGNRRTWRFKHAVNMQLGNPGGVVLKINGKRLLSGTSFPVLLNVTPGKPVTATMAGSSVEIPVYGPRH